MMRALGRLILVPLAFLLAVAAAGALLMSLGLERVTRATYGRSLDAAALGQLLDLLWAAVNIISVGTLIPALLVVIVGEVARIRSALYYILGGGLALSALPLLARSGSFGQDLAGIGLIWQVFATAGFAGGAVYWLLAGRNA